MIKKISNFDALSELEKIGFDSSYRGVAYKKHICFTFKIYDLVPGQATILKQSALSVGTDCAVHRHVIDNKIERTDCVITASVSQYEKLAKKLKFQPFSLKVLADDILELIKINTTPKKPLVMGILNITPDSFSDANKFLDTQDAIAHGLSMIKQGAKIIDIGAEATNPNASAVDAKIQIKRAYDVVQAIKKAHPEILISVDTRSSEVAAMEGVNIINDVSGFSYDKNIVNVAAKDKKKLVITHSRGTPDTMDEMCEYDDVVKEVYFELKKKCEYALMWGVKPQNIIVDVGFGFAKNKEQNYELLKHISEFKSLGYSVLAGVSKKRFLDNSPYLTNLASFYLAQNGVDIIRVHDVEATVQAIDFAQNLFN